LKQYVRVRSIDRSLGMVMAEHCCSKFGSKEQ
jgi:hypothetical protein